MICSSTFRTSFIENKLTISFKMLRIFKRVNWKSKIACSSWSWPFDESGTKITFRESTKWISLDHWCYLYCKYHCEEYRKVFQDSVLTLRIKSHTVQCYRYLSRCCRPWKSYPSIITERNGMKEITFPKVLICSHSMHSKKRLRKNYPQITG